MSIGTGAIYNVPTLRFIGQKLAVLTGWLFVTFALVSWVSAWPWMAHRSQITVVLMELPESSLAKITSAIREKVPHVREITYVSKAEGLKKVSEAPGFKDWGMWLSDNPVPPVLLVRVPPHLLLTDRALKIFQAIQAVPGVQLVVGEIPMLRVWITVFFAGGLLLITLWLTGAWTLGFALRAIAQDQALAVKGLLQQLKTAGATFPWALALSQKKQLGEWVAVSAVLLALLTSGMYLFASVFTGADLHPIRVWGCTAGVGLGGGWWVAQRVWRATVKKIWDELS